MKIIANSENGFLIQASKEEISYLWGLSGPYDEKFRKEMVNLGTEIDLVNIVKTAAYVRGMDKEVLCQIRKMFDMAQGQLASITNTVSKMTIFETLKE